MLDIMIWIDTNENHLEPSAKRLNRALCFDQVYIPDVCRFTKRDLKGKSRPSNSSEVYHYGMRVRLPATDFERVKNAIESCVWASTPKIKLQKVDVKNAWVEILSDEDVREKLLVQEELSYGLKKKCDTLIPYLLSVEDENISLKKEIANLKIINKNLCEQAEACRCNRCYIDLSYSNVV